MSSRAKIYTRTGDKGQTSLYGGKRVAKDVPQVEAYGSIDELNSVVGMVVCEMHDKDLRVLLVGIQHDLLLIGSVLSGAKLSTDILEVRVKEFENTIDTWDLALPELKHFILPGGSRTGAQCHFARSVARRSERAVVRLLATREIDNKILVYLNRLSDLFFAMSRFVNQRERALETEWKNK